MYGQQANTVGMASAKCGEVAAPPRDSTQLEMHLKELASLHEEASGVLNRVTHMADRLMGSEPSALNGGAKNGALTAAEPPLMTRMEIACQHLRETIQAVHYQLGRLDRL